MQSWEEFIFENRNKSYGSYQLRKKYFKYLLIGFVSAVALILIPLFAVYYHYQSNALVEEMPFSISVDLSHPIDLESLLDEPPPPLKVEVPEEQDKVPVVTDSAKELKPHESKIQSTVKDSVIKEKPANVAKGNGMNTENDTSAYIVIDEMPEYIGGKEEMFKFIKRNVVVPDVVTKKHISGVIGIQFVVYKTGDVRDVKLLSGIDPAIDNEVIRVIRNFPKWKPAKSAGRFISVKYTVHVFI